MQGIVHAIRHIALAALLLRALVPVGWMPAATAQTPFVICSINGPVQHAPDGQKLPDDAAHHQTCAFAAAPHLAKTPDVVALAAPALPVFVIARAEIAPALARPSPQRAQSPRAPPFST